MSIFDSVSNGIKEAMLSKDKVRLEAELTDEAAMKILAKMVKQRKESAEIFVSNNRSDLADANLAEAAIIEEFLPAQMSETELEEALKEIIARLGATSPQQMGMVMGAATKQLAGRADGRAISAKVKELLSK